VILVRQLSHPNILPCLASYVWGQTVCILTPLMDLGSCNDLITNHFQDGLPELAVAFILRDTLHGLDYIHRQGLILRYVPVLVVITLIFIIYIFFSISW
jgi:STE20-related kinase adapter protein alpha